MRYVFIKTALSKPFIRYIIIGTIGFSIDLITTYTLRDIYNLNQYFANSIGITLAIFNNFFFNKYWTFQEKNGNIFKQLSLFILVSGIGLLTNSLLIWVFHEYLLITFYLSKIMAIVMLVCWNYFVNQSLTFRKDSVNYHSNN